MFSPSACWFSTPRPAAEEPQLLPLCGDKPCDFEQSALECPFFSSGTYRTVDTDECDPFMRVRRHLLHRKNNRA